MAMQGFVQDQGLNSLWERLGSACLSAELVTCDAQVEKELVLDHNGQKLGLVRLRFRCKGYENCPKG
eukprot:6355611-Amphidinium_carterae.1